MRRILLAFLALSVCGCTAAEAQPSVDEFKRTLDAQLQKLKTTGFSERTVLFGEVKPGKPSGGTFPFQVTAIVHDYGTGYPPNGYFGQTCVGRMDKWPFEMKKNDFGDWEVTGRMTLTGTECKDNPGQGVSATPVESLPGSRVTAASAPAPVRAQDVAPRQGALRLGEYACYGTGGRLMAGMGFVLKADGSYADLDGARGGRYRHDATANTIAFTGGFLDGQTATNVRLSGFSLSRTVTCEPWK